MIEIEMDGLAPQLMLIGVEPGQGGFIDDDLALIGFINPPVQQFQPLWDAVFRSTPLVVDLKILKAILDAALAIDSRITRLF
jgi:hypothetical protein